MEVTYYLRKAIDACKRRDFEPVIPYYNLYVNEWNMLYLPDSGFIWTDDGRLVANDKYWDEYIVCERMEKLLWSIFPFEIKWSSES